MKAHRRYRLLLTGLYFVAVPALLAAGTVWLLTAARPGAWEETGLLGRLATLVDDQRIPALIVFFTLFEMALYQLRYRLPLAEQLGMAGRTDVPPELRAKVEEAAQLLEETRRITRRRAKQLTRDLHRQQREELEQAQRKLAAELDRDAFDPEAFQARYAELGKLADRHLDAWRKSPLREYAESIGVALLVALVLRTFLVEAFKIPSGSMLPTLQIQDHIFVNKLAYGPPLPFSDQRIFSRLPPSRGDVIVFDPPATAVTELPSEKYIKRVIAIPGDELTAEGGHPILNGWRVPSCLVGPYEYFDRSAQHTRTADLYVEYLGPYSYLTLYDQNPAPVIEGPFTVKDQQVWVMGDNRDQSHDSRRWNGGRGDGVPFTSIKGRSMFVWLSFGPGGNLTTDRLLHEVLGSPVLPQEAPVELTAGIAKCLAERPSVTLPPDHQR